jgi:hypothetical protein
MQEMLLVSTGTLMKYFAIVEMTTARDNTQNNYVI